MVEITMRNAKIKAVVLFTGAFLYVNASGAEPESGFFVSDRDSGAVPWTLKDFNNNAASFNFAIISDLTGGAQKDKAPEECKFQNIVWVSVADSVPRFTSLKLKGINELDSLPSCGIEEIR
jgi:hypothetical protein